ncbi:hypothetical protein GYA27_01455 [candidate division WWE3 bacterium]|uniref:Uncharacterized protein n=1 Tax=candidate division WWE3 bacterium TaxID=2053526 RepID=A0A7X9DKG1_UNCKA|nr:hypothetical protein [candidate division WWE3 bacterium]
MFGSNGKSRIGNPPVVWKWLNNRPVTGHYRPNGTFVDVRKGFMEFFMNAYGGLMVEFRPAKGVFVAPLTIEAEIVKTRLTRFGRCEAYKVSFKFCGTPVEIVLPQRYRVLLD